MDWTSLGISIGITLVIAIVGNVFIRKDQMNWFKSLKKPSIMVPISVFYVVGPIFYLICATILYRILASTQGNFGMIFVFTIIVITLNEVWNIFFFGLKSTYYGFIGVVVYFFPCLILELYLFQYEFISAIVFFPYLLWLIYDIIWSYELWKLNR